VVTNRQSCNEKEESCNEKEELQPKGIVVMKRKSCKRKEELQRKGKLSLKGNCQGKEKATFTILNPKHRAASPIYTLVGVNLGGNPQKTLT